MAAEPASEPVLGSPDVTGTVVHAYGVVPGGTPVAVPDTGIGAAGVALLDAGPVAAVFSRLPASDFGEAAWREHAEDPKWLAEVATQHQDVLGQLIEDTDVLPLRLPAMYRDEVHLHQMLESESTLFQAALGAIHDHVEWGVQLLLTGEPEAAAPSRPSSGRDYLMQRANAAANRERDRGRRQTLVEDAYAALADGARQSVVNQPQDPALRGRHEPMLLNSAHLVCRRHKDIFFMTVAEVAARLGPEGITVEVSGPWPPYNFVALGDEELQARP